METPISGHSSLMQCAVLWHGGIEEPHFDFLVETAPGSDLATWRLPRWPVVEPVRVTRLKDHRRIYLNYQGELTGDRGRVERIDGGVCTLKIGQDSALQIAAEGGAWTITLRQLAGDQWIAQGGNTVSPGRAML